MRCVAQGGRLDKTTRDRLLRVGADVGVGGCASLSFPGNSLVLLSVVHLQHQVVGSFQAKRLCFGDLLRRSVIGPATESSKIVALIQCRAARFGVEPLLQGVAERQPRIELTNDSALRHFHRVDSLLCGRVRV